jgi:hypothetical protein
MAFCRRSFVKNHFMKKFMIRKIPVVIAIATLGLLVFSGAVMLLWNSILPAVLHVSAITLWQAAGILLLSKILFGGRRGRGGMWGAHRRKRMFMRWHGMAPTEKEQMEGHPCYYNRYGQTGAETTDQPTA